MCQHDDSNRRVGHSQALQDRWLDYSRLIENGDPRRPSRDGVLKRSVIQIRVDDPKISILPQNLRQATTHKCIEVAEHDSDTPSVAIR